MDHLPNLQCSCSNDLVVLVVAAELVPGEDEAVVATAQFSMAAKVDTAAR